MPEPVTIEHGGLTVTTNMANEADLRASLEIPTAPPAASPPTAPETPATPPAPQRDDKGRFTKAEPATAPVETPAPPPEVPQPEDIGRGQTSEDDDGDVHRHPMDRMRKALKQKAAAERRAAAAEAALAQWQAYAHAQTPAAPTASPIVSYDPRTGPPQWKDFQDNPAYDDPYTAFTDAKTDWKLAQARVVWETEQIEKQRAQIFATNLAQGRTAYPDFDRVLTEADTLGLQVSAVMRNAIAESPRAADLVYFLATHPEECMSLAEDSEQMPVAPDGVKVMRRLLERSLGPRVAASNGAGTAARPAISTAKPPVTPVGSSPVVSDEPPGDDSTLAEHARYHNRKLKVPGTRY